MGYGADVRASGLFNVAVPFGGADGDGEDGGAFGVGDDDVTLLTENAIQLMDAPEMIEVLKVKTATVPTSVDVVRLREVMWRRVKDLANFDPASGKSRSQAIALGKKRGRDGEQDAEEDEDEGRYLAHLDDAKFSDVITSMLPDIRSITRDGTLSPAFFFFAILFLANEHRIILENDPNDVADLFITKLMPPMLQAQPIAATL
eukprot:GDKK01008495.1.p1 GENE.GDKK01008495.1~~GDKK01008495.1.p1  ORF type:complete len:203 (+),score=14.28 GDKK01008495.1:1-609(+)